ncbi:MAG: hypothetical protein CFE26_11040 [Verrucomicrobiales bacterium VVV1]|nr:MAG: hypothetical protein CFE26_11040 [Verrucomicrobiales bacterium VVV1]
MSSCDKGDNQAASDPRWIQLNGDRANLESRVSIAQMKLDRSQKQVRELEAAIAHLDDLTTRQIRLLDRQTALENETTAIDDAMLLMKARHLEMSRKEAIGKQLPSLRTVSGRSYDQAEIVGVTDAGIQIRHATGTARLLFQDLNESQRHQFGLDEGLGIAALRTEARQLRNYHEQIDNQLAEKSATQATVPETPVSTGRRIAKPISAFDRFVSLGSNSKKSGQVVARYNPSHRPTTYFYIPPSPRAACSP